MNLYFRGSILALLLVAGESFPILLNSFGGPLPPPNSDGEPKPVAVRAPSPPAQQVVDTSTSSAVASSTSNTQNTVNNINNSNPYFPPTVKENASVQANQQPSLDEQQQRQRKQESDSFGGAFVVETPPSVVPEESTQQSAQLGTPPTLGEILTAQEGTAAAAANAATTTSTFPPQSTVTQPSNNNTPNNYGNSFLSDMMRKRADRLQATYQGQMGETIKNNDPANNPGSYMDAYLTQSNNNNNNVAPPAVIANPETPEPVVAAVAESPTFPWNNYNNNGAVAGTNDPALVTTNESPVVETTPLASNGVVAQPEPPVVPQPAWWWKNGSAAATPTNDPAKSSEPVVTTTDKPMTWNNRNTQPTSPAFVTNTPAWNNNGATYTNGVTDPKPTVTETPMTWNNGIAEPKPAVVNPSSAWNNGATIPAVNSGPPVADKPLTWNNGISTEPKTPAIDNTPLTNNEAVAFADPETVTKDIPLTRNNGETIETPKPVAAEKPQGYSMAPKPVVTTTTTRPNNPGSYFDYITPLNTPSTPVEPIAANAVDTNGEMSAMQTETEAEPVVNKVTEPRRRPVFGRSYLESLSQKKAEASSNSDNAVIPKEKIRISPGETPFFAMAASTVFNPSQSQQTPTQNVALPADAPQVAMSTPTQVAEDIQVIPGIGSSAYPQSTSPHKVADHEIGTSQKERPFFTTFNPSPPRVPPKIKRRPKRTPVPKDLSKPRIQRIMERTSTETQTGGAGGSSTFEAFLRAEENWAQLKASKPFTYDSSLLDEVQNGVPPPEQFVTDDISHGSPRAWRKLRSQYQQELDYDTVVCGGTLGIFFATALALKGHRICVVEGGELRGREQEWNISMEELEELVALGVLTREDVDAAITTEFPGCRAGFKKEEISPLVGGYFENGVGYECFTPDVLNLGVSPVILLDRVKQRFLDLGGTIKEKTRLQGIVVSERVGSALDLGDDQEPITSRLVLDCMGNASPISRQQRYGKKPDGICAVVGSCAGGFDAETNIIGDIIYTNSEIKDFGKHGQLQYFWEAFPVGIGRDGKEPGTSDVKTTYMFTYFDAEEDRPSLEMLMEDYLDTLPKYQPYIDSAEDDLDFKRVLFAYFPTYKDSPLKPFWSRVLAVGDASGIQSPLSFGGFGSLTRHLGRITGAVSEALDNNILHKDDLAEINAYQPNLSAAWMFQKAMSIRMGQEVDSNFVNRLLATNFEVMNEQGQRVMKPFLKDVVRFDGLAQSLSGSFAKDPTFMPQIVKHVGIKSLAEWLCHVAMMAIYGVLNAVIAPILMPIVNSFKNVRQRFQWRRRMESWKFGSGSDFTLPKETKNK